MIITIAANKAGGKSTIAGVLEKALSKQLKRPFLMKRYLNSELVEVFELEISPQEIEKLAKTNE